MFKPGQLPTQIPPSHPAAINIIQAANRMGVVGLTPNYLAKPDMPLHLQFLFQPRPILVYVKPMKKNRCRQLDGFSSHSNNTYYMSKFEEVFEQSDEENEGDKPQKVIRTAQGVGLPQKKKVIYRDEKIKKHKELLKEEIKKWNPSENENITGDAYKSLFVARISYETTEKRLKKEFEIYGPIKTIKLIKDNKSAKSKGYCFIEYEHKRDFITAYKQADGKKIDGRRVLVDCERARVVKSWKPRRLGGGKGETRKGKDDYLTERVSRSRSRSKSHHHREKKKEHISKEKSKDRKKEKEKHRHREKANREKDVEKEKKKDRKDKDKEKEESKQKNEEQQLQQLQQKGQSQVMEIEQKQDEAPKEEPILVDELDMMQKEEKEKKKKKKHNKDKYRKKDNDSQSEEEPKEKHKKHKHKKKRDKGKEGSDEQPQEQAEEENKEREEGEQDVAELHPRKHKSKHHHHSKKQKENEAEDNDEEPKEKKKHKHHKDKESKKKKDKRKHEGSQQFIEQEYTADQQG